MDSINVLQEQSILLYILVGIGVILIIVAINMLSWLKRIAHQFGRKEKDEYISNKENCYEELSDSLKNCKSKKTFSGKAEQIFDMPPNSICEGCGDKITGSQSVWKRDGFVVCRACSIL